MRFQRRCSVSNLLISWALAIFAVLTAPAVAQDEGNLIQNGSFEAVDGFGFPEGWIVFPDPQPGSIQVGEGGDAPEGNRFLVLNNDPTGNNFQNPQHMVSQDLPQLPIEAIGIGLEFGAFIALDQQNPAPDGGLEIKIIAQSQPQQPLLSVRPRVPADGAFHPIQGQFDLSPELFPGGPEPLVLVIEKSAPGQVRVDDVTLVELPPQIADLEVNGISPNEGHVFGGSEDAQESGFDLITDNPVPGTTDLPSLAAVVAGVVAINSRA